MILTRRNLLIGLIAAPVVVRAASIMPVRPLIFDAPGLVGVCRVIKEGDPVEYAFGGRAAFRRLLEPGLRDFFEEAYGDIDRVTGWREVFSAPAS